MTDGREDTDCGSLTIERTSLMSGYPHAHHEYVGKDASGLPRCYGTGPTPDVAETECRKAIQEYVSRRPDTGPVSSWTLDKTN